MMDEERIVGICSASAAMGAIVILVGLASDRGVIEYVGLAVVFTSAAALLGYMFVTRNNNSSDKGGIWG